ncbi:MAG: tRNA (adenosine(37)-N6)-dimethylallyltransferase MiaA [Candidatus Shikimatogenerans bostrichidophilus]|nr:MAG: tRNA (adenosine(37)-N6)-dimethylallyltransferase MiaA [Candidatus Shikimatogenerans bostrichidophilus]
MKYLISILGPTGIGKTKISINLANFFKTEIISCDSRQFYKELKIGTSIPNFNYLKKVKHHFIGHISIFEDYNVYTFQNDAINILKKLFKSYNIVFIVGGSFLYEKSVIEGINYIPNINKKLLFIYREKLYKKSLNILLNKVKKKDYFFFKKILKKKKDKRKIIRALEIIHFTKKKISYFYKRKKKKKPFNKYIRIGIIDDRQKIYNNINNKVDKMIKKGLFYEVKKLYKYRKLNSLNTIGYKEFFPFLKKKEYDLNICINKIKQNTRNYAKRQIIWLRKIKKIKFFKPNEINKIKNFIINKIKLW